MNKISVLDHGYVVLRNLSGPTRRMFDHVEIPDETTGLLMVSSTTRPFDADDIDPANAARMSFDQTDAGRTREQDLKLAKYLMKNWHTSPFEMIECWFEVKMPIFVARQLIRHRTASVNEVSGRYITLPEEWYIPHVVGAAPIDKKQGQADGLALEVERWFKDALDSSCRTSYQRYLYAIEHGVAPEHARLFLHMNHYTHWLWKQDLHNMMHLLSLRLHSHAQIEAQVYAQAKYDLLKYYLPESMSLFDEYRRRT